MSMFDGVPLVRNKSKHCFKCGDYSDDWEMHHIMHKKGIQRKRLCYNCHLEITDINVVAWKAVGHKLTNGERYWLWRLFITIKPGSFNRLQLNEKDAWIAEAIVRMKQEFDTLKFPVSRAVNGCDATQEGETFLSNRLQTTPD